MRSEVLRLCRRLAVLKFDLQYDKARRLPWRVFDTELRTTLAKFDNETDARHYHNELITRETDERAAESLSDHADAPDLQAVSG